MGTKELAGREPVQWSHGEAVAAILVGSELPTKIDEREEGMGVVETLLILTVAAFHLAVVSWGIRSNQLVTNAFACKRSFEQRRDIALAVGKPVGKLKTVVCLNTLDLDPTPLIPKDGSLYKIGRGIGTLLRVGTKEAKP